MSLFRGHICYPLALTAREYFSARGIDVEDLADFIETGGFMTIMDCLVQHKFRNSPEALVFLQKNSELLGLPKHQISDDRAFTVYEEFCALFNCESMDVAE